MFDHRGSDSSRLSRIASQGGEEILAVCPSVATHVILLEAHALFPVDVNAIWVIQDRIVKLV